MSTNLKEKARLETQQALTIKKFNQPDYNTPEKDLSWAWPEAQRAYRDMERKAAKAKLLQSSLGQITAIDDFFTKIEEQFIAERDEAHKTDIPAAKTYDNVFLDICRWYEVTMLMLRTDNQNVKEYIIKRAQQPIKLPALPPRELTPLDQLVEKELSKAKRKAG